MHIWSCAGLSFSVRGNAEVCHIIYDHQTLQEFLLILQLHVREHSASDGVTAGQKQGSLLGAASGPALQSMMQNQHEV
jgi:hypothetical protein